MKSFCLAHTSKYTHCQQLQRLRLRCQLGRQPRWINESNTRRTDLVSFHFMIFDFDSWFLIFDWLVVFVGDARNTLINKCGFKESQVSAVVVETADIRDAVMISNIKYLMIMIWITFVYLFLDVRYHKSEESGSRRCWKSWSLDDEAIDARFTLDIPRTIIASSSRHCSWTCWIIEIDDFNDIVTNWEIQIAPKQTLTWNLFYLIN